VTKCDRGVKIGPNSVMYFMDGPIPVKQVCTVTWTWLL